MYVLLFSAIIEAVNTCRFVNLWFWRTCL